MTATRANAKLCGWCGASRRVHALAVEDKHTGRPVTLHLCEGCRESPTRTWRLRYKVQP